VSTEPNTTPFDPQLLPDVGESRFWRITHEPRSRKTPVKVTLMQYLPGTGTKPSFAHPLGYENTVAVPEEIYLAAETVQVRCERIDEVVGDHGL
jgi:hypothetical protein